MSYATLERHYRRLSHLEHLDAIAGWDEATMMAEGGGSARAEALATLRGIITRKRRTPRSASGSALRRPKRRGSMRGSARTCAR